MPSAIFKDSRLRCTLTCAIIITLPSRATAGGSYRNWKKRYFILSDASLKYYTKEGDNTPKKVIDLKQGRGIRNRKQCELEWPKDAKPGLSFGLATDTRTYYLYGDDKAAVK